nr:MAG TPA: hypothetical protein [Caudoviricetes sp.]
MCSRKHNGCFNVFVLSSFLKVAGTHALWKVKQVRILPCVFVIWHARWHTSLNKIFYSRFSFKKKEHSKQLVAGMTRKTPC